MNSKNTSMKPSDLLIKLHKLVELGECRGKCATQQARQVVHEEIIDLVKSIMYEELKGGEEN